MNLSMGYWMLITSPLIVLLAAWLSGMRYIPHNRVGIVEKLWAFRGSLGEGKIIALKGEAGFQAEVLRGGIHWFYYPWQYRIRKESLVVIAESKIGYVYARDGEPLSPVQTLGRVVHANNFQNTGAFLSANGQRGRQRGILREGVYAINLAQFVVITQSRVFAGPVRDEDDRKFHEWQIQLAARNGFDPVVIGGRMYVMDPGSRKRAANKASSNGKANAENTDANDLPMAPGLPIPPTPVLDDYVNSVDSAEIDAGEQMRLQPDDTIGVVTVHDGPQIDTAEIIAPEVTPPEDEKGHEYFQDPERFLSLGGCRGKQLQVLTDGTFFINRWFATVEVRRKTLIPIGFVGVVVSYYGVKGDDVTGEHFRYGEQVEHGHRGVWKRALPPGKYALNPYALTVELVPTVNFVLRWITGRVEDHQYDKELRSIEIITADGYEPLLPLSLVLHIDYQKAPRVVQRFGDVKRLISQTLDPILSAYFRDVAQSTHMLDFLTRREEIQRRATVELGKRFQDYDITCIAVLIGRPESRGTQYEAGNDPIEKLFDQLRMRRLAEEQIATFAKQERAALKLKELNDAEARATKQTELTRTSIDVEISGNRGEAKLAEARRLAKRDVVRAEGEGRAKELLGQGEAARVGTVGLAEASVFLKKIQAYGDPRLFALNLVSEKVAESKQPLVPERLFMLGGKDGGDDRDPTSGLGLFGYLIAALLAEKSGFDLSGEHGSIESLETFAAKLAEKVGEPGEKSSLESDDDPEPPEVPQASENPDAAEDSDISDIAEEVTLKDGPLLTTVEEE